MSDVSEASGKAPSQPSACAFTWALLLLAGISLTVAWLSQPTSAADAAIAGDWVYRVPINEADEVTLQLLPGIGPSLAANIAAYREAHGPLVSPAQLEEVHRIGPKLRERITPWIDFGDSFKVESPSSNEAERR